MNYVVGFLFSADIEHVVLIEKRKPAWQVGLLNGVGGKIEIGETPRNAMAREFREETGADVQPGCWSRFAVMSGPDTDNGFYSVHCFVARGSAAGVVSSTTDEKVFLKEVRLLELTKHVPNLSWLIPMAQQVLQGHGPAIAGIHY
jgi:8-oxo-dGTP diphosphatase